MQTQEWRCGAWCINALYLSPALYGQFSERCRCGRRFMAAAYWRVFGFCEWSSPPPRGARSTRSCVVDGRSKVPKADWPSAWEDVTSRGLSQ